MRGPHGRRWSADGTVSTRLTASQRAYQSQPNFVTETESLSLPDYVTILHSVRLVRSLSWTWGFSFVLGVLTLALHRGLLGRFGSAIPSDLGDPLLNTWILWWNAQAVPFTQQYWNAPAFAPAPYALALSETLLGLTWLTTPLQWLGASPVVAYNVMFVAIPVLNGLSAYWLCLTLTGRRDAAMIGGLAFAFAPYHATQFAHIQTQATFWMPVALVGLHKYWSTSQRKWLVCLGGATALNGLTCGYFLLYFAVLLALAVGWLTIASGTRRKVMDVLVTLAIAALVLAPVILTYRFVKSLWDLQRPASEIESLSSDALAVLMGSDRLLFWPIRGPEWQLPGGLYPQYPGIVITLLLVAGAVVAIRQRRHDLPRSRWRGWAVWTLVAASVVELVAGGAYWIVGQWELGLGPITATMYHPYRAVGVAIRLLLVALLLTPRFTALVRSGSPPGLYATGAVLASILALGPVGRISGARVWSPAPLAWLMPLPGFDSIRVPALFSAITVLCFAVLAAYAVARLVPRPMRTSLAITGIVGFALIADGWAVMPIVDVPAPIRVPIVGDLVVELPRHDLLEDVAAMYRGMEHGRPVVNGYSGYNPPHYGYLLSDLGRSCFDSLDVTRGGRSLDVVIWVGTEEARRIDAVLLKRWGRSVREEWGGTIVYHVPRASALQSPPAVDRSIDLRYFCARVRPR